MVTPLPTPPAHSLCHLQLLTPDQIETLKRAALDVMAATGFRVCHAGARKLLEQAGAMVEGDRVRVPAEIVESCLASAPKGWTVFDREGEPAMEVRGRNSYFGTSTAAPNTLDAVSGAVRPATLADIAAGARLADALEQIDFVMPFGSAQDVPQAVSDLYEFEAVITHTAKPLIFLGSNGEVLERIIEMAAVAAGSLERLREKPFLVLFPVHLSPLVFPEAACGRLLTAAAFGIPQVPSSAIQMGATGPITVAGAVALALAEGLFCVVLAQLKQPGCPVALAANFVVFDMATSLMSVAAPAASLAYGLHAEVARSLGLPTWGLAGGTDAKVIDAQAGIEATYHLFAQALAGVNLIHDVGYVDSAMACSPVQLVMGNEIIAMVRQFIRGAAIDADTLATDLIQAVGPGGQFLTRRHTLTHLRSAFWRPGLLNRQPRTQWEEKGARSLETVAREECARILETHRPKALDGTMRAAIERIRIRGERELGR